MKRVQKHQVTITPDAKPKVTSKPYKVRVEKDGEDVLEEQFMTITDSNFTYYEQMAANQIKNESERARIAHMNGRPFKQNVEIFTYKEVEAKEKPAPKEEKTLLEKALESGAIEKKGNLYYLNGEKIGGKRTFADTYENDEEFKETLDNLMNNE